ncbi:MAG: hypothetical protein ABI628_09695, partial [Chloroflexota bacterium]
MSAPSVAVETSLGRLRQGRTAGRDRFARLVEGWFRVHAALVYGFLYLPILVVVVFAFNGTNRYVTDWQGLSLKGFQAALADGNVQRFLGNSLVIAFVNAILVTMFGTMAALGLQRVPRKLRSAFDALTYMSVIIPEIVIGLATLILFRRLARRCQSRPGRPSGRRRAARPAAARPLVGHRRTRPVQPEPGPAARPGKALGDGSDPGRGELRPVRDPVADVPPDHLPAAPAGHRR